MNMKSNLTKLTMAGALLLGYAGMASAHDLLNQPIGATLSATDYYQVTCSTDGVATLRLDVQVNDDTAGASILSLQVQKGLLAKNTTDPTGANGVFSPLVSVAGGNGVYNVMVNKTTAAARQYDIRYHCMNGTAHTGTAIAIKQNQ
jgi:hypothetical protein